METFEAAYPRHDHVLLHLGDTHLMGAGLRYNHVDAGERLKRAFAAVGLGAFVAAEGTSRGLFAAGVRIPSSTSLPAPAAAGACTGNPEGRTGK